MHFSLCSRRSVGAHRSLRGIFGGVVRAFCAAALVHSGHSPTSTPCPTLKLHRDFTLSKTRLACIANLTSVNTCIRQRHLFFDHNNANNLYRKPPNSARVPSSTHGSLTNSRPSVSVVSPSISLSGSSRPPSTTSLLLMLPVTVISSRT
jgi:hypothetical protein